MKAANLRSKRKKGVEAMREFEDELPVFGGDARGYVQREARYRRQWYAQPQRARLDWLFLCGWITMLILAVLFYGGIAWAVYRLVSWVVSHG